MVNERISNCDRFEELLAKNELTDAEFDFCVDHQQACSLGIHTTEALERRHGFPPGSLRTWNGLPPFPGSLPGLRETYLKRVWEVVTEVSPDPIRRPRVVPAVAIRAPQSAADQNISESRRSFLVGMTIGAAACLVGAVVKASGEASWLGAGVFGKYQELLSTTRHHADRPELLAQLLKPAGDIAYSAAKSHLGLPPGELASYWQKFGLPHDRAAIAAFRTLDPVTPTAKLVDGEEMPVAPVQSLIVAGSPVSSDEARIYLPYRDLVAAAVVATSNVFRPESIPYHFLIGSEERIVVRSGMLGGKEVRKRAHGIEIAATGKLWQPRQYVDSANRLKTDFLIVTRLPRNLSGGGDVILITGGHGPGAEAFALLFDEKAFPTSELLNLCNALEGARYFQFVLECSDICHDEPMSSAHKLSISEDCPPRVIKHSADLFKEWTGGSRR